MAPAVGAPVEDEAAEDAEAKPPTTTTGHLKLLELSDHINSVETLVFRELCGSGTAR